MIILEMILQTMTANSDREQSKAWLRKRRIAGFEVALENSKIYQCKNKSTTNGDSLRHFLMRDVIDAVFKAECRR